MAGPFEDGVEAHDRGDFATALELWLPLAEQGHVAAQFNVGVLYEKGFGVAQDRAEAARWYLKAAQQGDIDAQYNVGVMYETGTGVAQDSDQARKWYAAVLSASKADAASLTTKQHARQHLVNLSRASDEVIEYEGGRFVFSRSGATSCVIALQGTINRATLLKFDDVVDRAAKLGCSKPLLLLESPGGLLSDGLALGKEVRIRGFRTVARYSCASACAMIFLAGTERTLVGSRAKIGLHQPASGLGKKARHCGGSADSNGVREMRSYVNWVIPDVADQVMKLTMQTSCDAIEWVYGKRALELGIATSIQSEDVDVFGSAKERP